MNIWAIYDHPRDYPDKFVVRVWRVTASGTHPGDAWLRNTLDEARDVIQTNQPGAYRLPRMDSDDPKIVEAWI